ASAAAANSGVPAKTSRSMGIGACAGGSESAARVVARSPGRRRAGPLRVDAFGLQQPVADARLLQPRQVLDENASVQVIDLVLNAHGEQSVGLELERPTALVERTHDDA